jgi:hypothetical protein
MYLKDQLANLLEEFQLLKQTYDSANQQIVALEGEVVFYCYFTEKLCPQ